MTLTCCGSFIKCVIIFFNVIVFVSSHIFSTEALLITNVVYKQKFSPLQIGGLVTTSSGIYLIVETYKYGTVVPTFIPGYLVIIGFLICLLGFMGCSGALFESACLLKTVIIAVYCIYPHLNSLLSLWESFSWERLWEFV